MMALLDVNAKLPAGYDDDFFLWTQEQAALLRNRNDGLLDWANLAEEIESLGKRERREVYSRMEVLLLHLIKWRFQPENRSSSWAGSIRNQRTELNRLLADSPSLRGHLDDALSECFPAARDRAAEEMRLLDIGQIPKEPMFALNEVMDDHFLPHVGGRERPW